MSSASNIVVTQQIQQSHLRMLNPGGNIGPREGSDLLYISMPKNTLEFKELYLNIDVNVPTSTVYPQNIANTSVVPIGVSVQYRYTDGTVFNTARPTIPSIYANLTVTKAGGLDNLGGNHFLTFRDIKLKGVDYSNTTDLGVVSTGQNFERLLLYPGYFQFGAAADIFGAGKVLGAGVTNSDLLQLLAYVNFSLVYTSRYAT